ncbi:MAG: hypothetical protein ACYSOZ_08010, partial [Planctomycetota bacterium]
RYIKEYESNFILFACLVHVAPFSIVHFIIPKQQYSVKTLFSLPYRRVPIATEGDEIGQRF